MKVLISKKEFGVLLDIRGVPDTVHSMLYAFKEEDGKHVLEGDEDSFDDLLGLRLVRDSAPRKIFHLC